MVALNKHFHVNHFLMANILNEKMKVVPDKEVLDDGTIIDHSKNMYDEMKLDERRILGVVLVSELWSLVVGGNAERRGAVQRCAVNLHRQTARVGGAK